ncbi:hypothetical protein NC653_037845 [Populus alba x Populus x berolinensis]|uniref:DUF4283 domain-containing protein n=1 Tax=Populus alba x Populus x berolinensis TaxID=444605 RepID=A0AAD6LGT9_9ROSI|nr:hypothetical protein NC653_037845 [Populus alba x Populus x berolinensis]
MANKKKKSGPSKYEIKRQKSLAASQLVNNSTILALTAPPSSGTVHATVPPNSNSDLSPPIVLPPQSPCPTHPIPSSSHGSEPQHRGDSPSINHVFVEDWSEDEGPDDEELEYDSAEEEYAGGSKFFTSPVNITAIAAPTDSLLPIVVSPVVAQTTPGSFLTRETPALVVSPALATSAPVGPVNGAASLATTVSAAEHPPQSSPSSWRNLFASNRNITTCPKLMHYSAFTETNGCDLVGDDLDAKCGFWKLCLIGYVAGSSPGYKALQNVIVNSWKCEASLTMHESGWLIFKFATDADKLSILAGGPYLIYGRPLILRPMPVFFFYFSSSDMHTVLVWVKFPNLPLQCWSLKCLSKIASVLGRPVQSDMLTHTMSRLSYARVLVEVNLLSDLPYSIDINLPNDSLLKQQVIYETLPRFCKHCRTLGHLTSTCPKSVSLTDSNKQATHVSAPAPSANTVKKSVFDRLGPQKDSLVVVCPEGNLPLNSAPILFESELVSVSGVVDPVSSGWNIVQSKRIRRKTSPSKHRVRPSHVDHCTGPAVHAPVDSRGHRSPTGSHIQPGPNSNVLAGSRFDKGKFVVVSVAPGPPSAGVSSVPLRRRAQRVEHLKQHEVYNLMRKHKLDVCCLLETKLVSSKVSSMRQFRLKNWKVLSNVAAASTARIVVFWNPETVNIDLLGFSAQGLHTNKHRGEAVSTYETSDFRQCCSDLGLADLNYYGSHFTWSNGNVWSKLDRVLANPLWSLSHTSVHVHFDNLGAFSDHSPATVSFHPQQLMGKKCFKFFNMWTTHSRFLELVAEAW